MLDELLNGLEIGIDFQNQLALTFSGDDCLPSCFKTTQLASNSFMAAAVALVEYCNAAEQGNDLACAHTKSLNVNNRYASLWFARSLWPLGWKVGGVWDAIAGDYKCADGWIRLHTNAPHHKQAALSILQCDGTRDAVAATLANVKADDAELAIVQASGCAATMRSLSAWQQHPQGLSVANEPLVHWEEHGVVDAERIRFEHVDSSRILQQYRQDNVLAKFEPVQEPDLNPVIENATWGDVRRVWFPIEHDGVDASWDRPATELRLFAPQWL